MSRLLVAGVGVAVAAVMAKRAASSSNLQTTSAPPPATGLSLDQAAAIAENAAHITKRIDEKAARLRLEVCGKLLLCFAATTAAALLAPAWAAALVAAACAAALVPTARRAAANERTRTRMHGTIHRARSQVAAASEPDGATSDSMDPALDAVAVNPLVRRAVRLMRGQRLRTDSAHFELAVFSAVPWFKVTERYPVGGEERQFRRRDLRRGRHTGSVTLLPGGRVRVRLAWGEPRGGVGEDVYSLDGPDALRVDSWLEVAGGGRVAYTTRYRRAK